MKLKLVIRQIAGQHDRIGVVPPEPAVLPVTTQILTRGRLDAFPRAFDVVRAARAVNQSERGPDRMITTKHKTVLDAAQYRLHAAPISLDARCVWIVKTAAVNRAPEVRVELEVSASPVASHRAEEIFEMLLHFRMSAVEHVPWTMTPATERHSV